MTKMEMQTYSVILFGKRQPKPVKNGLWTGQWTMDEGRDGQNGRDGLNGQGRGTGICMIPRILYDSASVFVKSWK